jgi:predicted translin family RNA/ssDNA-binding protein
VVKGNKQYYDAIAIQFSSVSRDLQGLNAHRYARQISGGCQEYVEAASFQHYLTTATILSYEEAASQMKSLDAEGPGVELSLEDYLLGIYDMTGELMKFAITAMATSGSLPSINTGDTTGSADAVTQAGTQRTVLTDMRNLRAALESLDSGTGPFAKEVDKKAEVMRASVEKVEKALYGLTVRGAERPKGWLPDTSDAARAVEVEG